MSNDNWWSKNTSIGQLQERTIEEYKYTNFFATETIKWNTSKQVSTKETTLWNVCKYSKKNFFWNKVSIANRG